MSTLESVGATTLNPGELLLGTETSKTDISRYVPGDLAVPGDGTLTELIEDIIDGYACCGGRGAIYNEPREDKNLDYRYGDSARALVQILRDQADLLEARISDTIPSAEDHVKHMES